MDKLGKLDESNRLPKFSYYESILWHHCITLRRFNTGFGSVLFSDLMSYMNHNELAFPTVDDKDFFISYILQVFAKFDELNEKKNSKKIESAKSKSNNTKGKR